MTLGIVSLDDGFELRSWAELEKLAENAAYSIQSGTSLVICVLVELQINISDVPL